MVTIMSDKNVTKITASDGKIFDVSWLSQELLGRSSTQNLLPKAIGGKIWSPEARRNGHSSVTFSKTSEWPNLARVNTLEQFSLYVAYLASPSI
jgi:hypothetical protein